MKKAILSLAVLVAGAGAFSAYADEEVAKKQYLPEKGNFAIGVDVMPVLRTLGGAFNTTSNVPVGGTPFSYQDMFIKPDVALHGKYMVTDNWAVKANFGVVVNNYNKRYYVADDLEHALDPNSEAKVIDTESTTRSGMTLKLGAEYRLGKHRVQGVFGVGAMFGFSTYAKSYSYGNAITELNRTPSSISVSGLNIPAGYRPLSAQADGANFMYGVYGSAGAEWFVAPKISLGADVNLSLYGLAAAKGKVKSEGYNEAYMSVEQRTDLVSPGNNGVVFGTDNLGGSLYLSFYF